MPKTKAVFFDLDDALFDSTGLAEKARKEACKNMIKEGLPASISEACKRLNKIVLKFGSNYNSHFDELCKDYGVGKERRIKLIAAGIKAYHDTKFLCLKPFPDVIKTLRKLKRRAKLALITNGRAIKQWDKIYRLEISSFFDKIYISDESEQAIPKEKLARKALRELYVLPEETVWVGDRIDTDIYEANRLGIVSVQLLHGKYRKLKPKNKLQVPRYKIKRISEVIRLI